ncbi:MAG: hypothetical protein ACM3II_17865 [Rhodospirillaceae bacterium]
MAEASPRKSRRDVLYGGGRKSEAKLEAKPEAKPAPAAPAAGHSTTHADMFRRHEADRRTMHGNHRTEHRAIETEGGPDVMKKKMAAHRRHRSEMDSMHERHEQELLAQLGAMHQGDGGAPQAEAA